MEYTTNTTQYEEIFREQYSELNHQIFQRGNGWAPGIKSTMLGNSPNEPDDGDDADSASFEIDTDDILR